MNIRYAIVKNEMPASSTEAKYLGQAIPNGVRNRAQLTAKALEKEHFAEATFAAVIDAAVAITQELCAEGHDVDWGPAKFISKMHGSLPCEDSAFGDGTASLTLDADATNETRAALESLVPVKASAAEIASLIKVSNLMDVESELFGTVVGPKQFVILGNGITLDAEGEYAKALDKKSLEVKGTATVENVSKGQRAYCRFSPQLAGGDYTLEVATKGLLGETTPRVFRKPFTAVPFYRQMSIADVFAFASGGSTSVSFTCKNLSGSLGYAKTATGSTAVAYFKVNGGEEFSKTLAFEDEEPTGFMNVLEFETSENDTLTITFKPDPAKAQVYAQEPATATVTVSA